MDFLYAKEAIVCYHQINIFSVSKDEWNTEEDNGKNALYVLH